MVIIILSGSYIDIFGLGSSTTDVFLYVLYPRSVSQKCHHRSAIFRSKGYMTDDEILIAIQAGGAKQNAALRALYHEKGREFQRYFMWTWRLSRDDADDVLQETVLKILRFAESYRPEGTASAWMWQIARNTVTDNHRKKSKETSTEELDEGGQRMVENQTTSAWGESTSRSAEECVAKGLTRFKEIEPDRAYVIELLVEGVDGQEIANRISRSYTATRQYLTQCRKAFAPYIGPCLPLLST